MGLQNLFVKGVSIIDRIVNSLEVPVRHEAWIANGSYGKDTYASAVSRLAVVELKQRLRRLDSGQEVLQHASVLFPRPIRANGATGRREPIDPRDRITLPNGYTGPILNVEGVVNPNTNYPYALEIILG